MNLFGTWLLNGEDLVTCLRQADEKWLCGLIICVFRIVLYNCIYRLDLLSERELFNKLRSSNPLPVLLTLLWSYQSVDIHTLQSVHFWCLASSWHEMCQVDLHLPNFSASLHIMYSSTPLDHQKMPHGRGFYQTNRLDQKRAHGRDKTETRFCSGLLLSAILLSRGFGEHTIQWHGMCRLKREARSALAEKNQWLWNSGALNRNTLASDVIRRAFNHLLVCTNNEARQQLEDFPHCPSIDHKTFVWALA